MGPCFLQDLEDSMDFQSVIDAWIRKVVFFRFLNSKKTISRNKDYLINTTLVLVFVTINLEGFSYSF